MSSSRFPVTADHGVRRHSASAESSEPRRCAADLACCKREGGESGGGELDKCVSWIETVPGFNI